MDPPNPVLPAPGRPVPPRDHTQQLTSSVEAGPAVSHFLETKLEELSPFAHQGTLEQVTPDPLLASGGGFIPQPGYTHRVAPPQERGWRETRGSVPSRRLTFSPSGFQPRPPLRPCPPRAGSSSSPSLRFFIRERGGTRPYASGCVRMKRGPPGSARKP